MKEKDEKILMDEIREFEKEKDRIRQLVGNIGGNNNKQVKKINALLIGMIIFLLFMGGVLRKMSVELTMYLAILLGIIKIIWMLYETKKSTHFQFWILNSIEVKINELSKRVNKIERRTRKFEDEIKTEENLVNEPE